MKIDFVTKYFFRSIILISLLNNIFLYGNSQSTPVSPKIICKNLHLIPGEKAMIQWQRVFKNPRKLKRYGLDKLDLKERKKLEEYLVNHAADSDQPMVAGM